MRSECRNHLGIQTFVEQLSSDEDFQLGHVALVEADECSVRVKPLICFLQVHFRAEELLGLQDVVNLDSAITTCTVRSTFLCSSAFVTCSVESILDSLQMLLKGN